MGKGAGKGGARGFRYPTKGFEADMHKVMAFGV